MTDIYITRWPNGNIFEVSHQERGEFHGPTIYYHTDCTIDWSYFHKYSKTFGSQIEYKYE